MDRRDPKLMASRMATLLEDRDPWSRLSTAGAKAARRYSPDEVIPRLEATLREVTQG